MSRIARKPLEIPSGIEIKQSHGLINVKGQKGGFDFPIDDQLKISIDGNNLMVSAVKKNPLPKVKAMVGTIRKLLENAVIGLSKGFEKKLILKGVGYRAKMQGKVLELNLGYSHPVKYSVPEGIAIESPSNTEVLVKGADKQKVGQVAAEIRELRPPENYKGKGVCYADERVLIKETKKK